MSIGEYFYDGDGKRVKKVAGNETTIFIYDASSKLVAEYSNQTPQNPQVSYLTTDHLGSPRINTDASGQVTARHDYQPFGEEITRASYGNDDVRKQFTGYEKDEETDLDFAQARYFNSGIGRFSSPDPLFYTAKRPGDPQQFNLYAYVRNNPLVLIDPDGKDLRAKSRNDNGELVDLTKEDRKTLQAALRKLAPDANIKVKKNGEIIIKEASGNYRKSVGNRLIQSIIDSDKTVTVAVGKDNKNTTIAVNSDLNISNKQVLGGVSDSLVSWDPNSTTNATTLENGQLATVENESFIVLGHELIHGRNFQTGEVDGDQFKDYEVRTTFGLPIVYIDPETSQREIRAVGLASGRYNRQGDFTENQLRQELKLPPRVAYGGIKDLRLKY